MLTASTRAEEIVRRRCNRAAKIDLYAVTDRNRGRKIHSLPPLNVHVEMASDKAAS